MPRVQVDQTYRQVLRKDVHSRSAPTTYRIQDRRQEVRPCQEDPNSTIKKVNLEKISSLFRYWFLAVAMNVVISSVCQM